MSDLHAAVQNAQEAVERLAASLENAKRDKAAAARQLTATQEELRRVGLLSPRRAALRNDVTRFTERYAAVSKQVTALQAELEQAQLQLTIQRAQLAKQKRTEPVPESAPDVLPDIAPVKPVQRAPRMAAQVPVEARVAHVLARLEQFYPEHQVYALDSISADLRAKVAKLAKETGHADAADFLADQGWRTIRGEAVHTLRRGKHTTPGEEPAVIRPQVVSMLRRLNACYPDRVIPRSIQRDHKSLAQDITGLYQWLGYESIAAMLTAYGYTYLAAPKGGRPAKDAAPTLALLRGLYPEEGKPASIQQILRDYPDLAPSIKTLQNKAPSAFGMTLKEYLREKKVIQA